jgi:hypothetical protein
MKCLLWRQHRAQLMWAAVVVVVYGIAMFLVGHSAHDWLGGYDHWLGQLRAEGCPLPDSGPRSVHTSSQACETLLTQYRGGAQPSFAGAYNFAIPVFEEGLPLVVVLIAVLIGAPLLAREVEQRTQLIAWTQSIGRRRWYVTKTAVLAAGLATIGLLAGVANDRLQIPLSAGGLTSSRWPWFFSIDIGLAAEAIVAFALAVTLGAWLRRTLPAIGGALVGFLIVFLLAGWAVRSLTPVTKATGPRSTPDNAWIVGGGYYHPASQYWPLQLTYVVVLLVLSTALLVIGWRATRARAVI